jgi:hypothetical protein
VTNLRHLEKIVFYFPWREVSGGPYYLTRLAEELAKDPNYKVYYTDYDPGLSDELLTTGRVEKIIVSEKDFGIGNIAHEPVTLITPIYWACWLPSLHPKSKVLFFNWHICSMPLLKKQWGVNKKQMNLFLQLVRSKDAVFFCDYSHWLGQNTKKILFNKKYVPIPLPPKFCSAKPELISDSEMRIIALGRLCADKIYSFINLLDNFQKVETSLKKYFYIIGDGPEKDLIKVENYPDITIHFEGTLTNEDLVSALTEKGDILFAMGTSVLEGAALKLPSVIIPHNMHAMDCDRFVYLQDTRDYCLGWYDTQMDELSLPEYSLGEILKQVYEKGEKKNLGELAFEYYKSHHSIESAAKSLKSCLNDTTLTVKSFLALTKAFFFKHRRYIIFGLTIIKTQKNLQGEILVYVFKLPLFKIKTQGGTSRFSFNTQWVDKLFAKLTKNPSNL